MTPIEAYDPGLATGYAWGEFSDDEPFKLLGAEILTDRLDMWCRLEGWADHTVVRVVEDFRLRGGNKFTADLSGDRLIGAMEFQAWNVGVPLVLQQPTDKALVPDHILKEHGLWQTGKMVDHVDGRDANDAIIHALAYLFKIRHAPTIDKYFLEAD